MFFISTDFNSDKLKFKFKSNALNRDANILDNRDKS